MANELGCGSTVEVKIDSAACLQQCRTPSFSFKNIHLEFLPPSSSLVQPMDMGILKEFEDISRKYGKLHP
jgi:hypothetical protein